MKVDIDDKIEVNENEKKKTKKNLAAKTLPRVLKFNALRKLSERKNRANGL